MPAQPTPPTPDGPEPTGHVIVCGYDHLGQRTVGELRLRDQRVVVVSASPVAGNDAPDGVEVVLGDARQLGTLRAAGVPAATAIVLTGDDDHANLDIALATQEVNPAIRIVIRMFDADLGTHLEQLFPSAVVLSSSALAAPAFVSAALDGESGERFELAGHALIARMAGTAGSAPAPVAQIPIARLHADRTVDLLPRDAAGAPDLIVVDVEPPGVSGDGGGPSLVRGPSLGARLRALPAAVRAWVARTDRRLVRFAAVLVGLAVISTLYFELTAGLSPLDAVSFAISMLTGASLLTSIDAATAPVALKVYAIGLSLVGAALVAVIYALITDAMIRSRLLQTLGRRSVPATIADHVIVCGLGSIGYRVVQALRARGATVVVVESDEDGRFVAAARAIGVPVVIGDSRQREVLTQVGLAGARALLAVTSDDLVNLAAALNARVVRPDLRVVVRLFDPAFAIRVQHGFGIRFTRSVSHLAAPAFATAALGSEVVAAIPVGDQRVILVARLPVMAGSALDGVTVASTERDGERRVMAVIGGGGTPRWVPSHDAHVVAGEELVVAATRRGLAELLELSRVPQVEAGAGGRRAVS